MNESFYQFSDSHRQLQSDEKSVTNNPNPTIEASISNYYILLLAVFNHSTTRELPSTSSKMNLSQFISFCIVLWYCNYTVEVQSEKQKALIFNQNTEQLMELQDDDDSAKCTHCITACPLSTEIIKRATVSGYGLLVQKVYDDAENPIKIKTDICDKPMTPSIVYNLKSGDFEIGYEMFYGKNQLINLSCFYYYEYLLNVIDGEQNQDDSQLINDESITTTSDEDSNIIFQINGNPDETMVFYWISVLNLKTYEYAGNRRIYKYAGNRRHFTIGKDVINDYFHKEGVISHCENYYLSVGTEIVPLKREMVELTQPVDDKRLEKTQIVPMHMLHTVPGRLATCLYANIAFIWSSIANGQLQEVDLFLYALYKLHPSNINIYFGVRDELEGISPELTASENPIFRKYPIPKFMYRIVEWINGGDETIVYKVIVVIHNDPKSINKEDRICSNSDQVPGWNDIKSSDTATITGTSYTCPYRGERTLSKMGLHPNFSWESFSVEHFPTIDDSDGHFSYSKIGDQVRDEFNRLKSLKN
ncbi:uncharacterized protein LOC135848035 [Planococcus citri]|uniref:uncharacterized protein LOC135848035 n=1 Tax=Planococcus citri TaxID=170843 RepID=UPI0031F7B94C